MLHQVGIYHCSMLAVVTCFPYCVGATYLVQSLDVSINGPFKKLIEDQFCEHLQENLDLYTDGKVCI